MNRTISTSARRWLSGALIAAASAAILLPGTAAAEQKTVLFGARTHSAPHYSTHQWNGAHHSAPQQHWNSAHPTTHHGWNGNHNARPPQPGQGALWYGARPAGGRQSSQHEREPQARGLAWQGHNVGNHEGQRFWRRVQ